MDVWGPARVRGQGHERYFLLVVDDYSRYTTVFPLRRKGEVTEVLINWIRSARRQLSESFGSDLPVLRLHSDRGGEFSFDLLRAFCRAEGIRQTFTLPASPQQNGIAERRIGMVMDVARTSLIHAAAPHFLWPFAVQYAAHQINLQPRVSLPETTPTLRWTGKVGDASVFRFYHPTSRRVLSSQDVTFDESVSYYRLFPYRTAPLPPLPLFLAPGAPPVDPLPPQGPAPSGVFQVDPVEPVEVAVDSVTAKGAEPARAGAGPGGAEPGVAESEGVEPGGAEPERVEPGGAESGGAKPGGAERGGAEPERAESGGPPSVPSRREPLSPQRLREWYARRCSRAAGATGPTAGGASGAGAAGGAAGAGAAGAAGPGGAGAGGTGAVGGPAGVGAAGGAGAAGPGGARTGGTGAAGAGGAAGVGAGGAGAVSAGGAAGAGAAGGAGAGGAAGVVARDPGAEGTGTVSAVSGGAAWPRPYYVPLLQQVLGLSPSTCPPPPLLSPPPVQSQLQPASPLPGPSPYPGPTRESSLPVFPDPPSDLARASKSVCPPSVGGECALGTDVLEDRQEEFECFAATLPHLVSMLIAPEGDPDAPDIPTPRSYAEAIEGPYSSQWQIAMDAEMASWKSTGTYVDEVPPPGANIVSGMWIFRVKRPPGSPPVFKARYVARGFRQPARGDLARRPPGFTGSFPAGTQWSLRRPVYGLRQAPREWHDTLRTTLAALGFAPSTADPSLFLRTDISLPPLYILVYVDDLVFATSDTAGLAHVKSELQKRHTCTDLGELRSYLGLQITRDRAQRTITLTQSHMVQQVLQRFGFEYSSPQSTPLPTGHSLSALPLDESVEPSGPYPELVGCLMYLMTCTRPDLAYPLSILARYVAPGRHRPEH
ncbi:unnamed protein product [Closterium sp. Naga37s-1]|nr:unnamed protein product [Closterium sp. Naga37s-1]